MIELGKRILIAVTITAAIFGAYSELRWVRALDEFLYVLKQPTEVEAASDLVLVAITASTLEALGPFPWDRSMVSAVIERILRNPGAYVAFDIFFDSVREESGDKRLVDLVRQYKDRICLAREIVPSSGNGVPFFPSLNELKPVTGLATYVAPERVTTFLGESTFELSYDIGAPNDSHRILTFPVAAYCQWINRNAPKDCEQHIRSQLPWKSTNPVDQKLFLEEIPISFVGYENRFNVVPFEEIATGTSKFNFARKLVLIGVVGPQFNDRAFVPLTAFGGREMDGVVMWANALNTLLSGNYIKVIPPAAIWGASFLLAFIFSSVGRMRYRTAVIAGFVLALLVVKEALFIYLRVQMVVVPLFLSSSVAAIWTAKYAR